MSAFAAERQFWRPVVQLQERRIINALIDPHRLSRRSSFIVPDVMPEERSANYFPVSHSVARPATAATRFLRTLASYR